MGDSIKRVSRNSAHDGEGEGKRGLVTVVHRVNYTIFAALRVGFRGSELGAAAVERGNQRVALEVFQQSATSVQRSVE